jgi:hypothetical protein
MGYQVFFSAEGGTRTRTLIRRLILSQLRLPFRHPGLGVNRRSIIPPRGLRQQTEVLRWVTYGYDRHAREELPDRAVEAGQDRRFSRVDFG